MQHEIKAMTKVKVKKEAEGALISFLFASFFLNLSLCLNLL